MVHRPNKDGPPQLPMALPALLKKPPTDSQPVALEKSDPELKDAAKSATPKQKTSDLFSAHDFDIKIDLEVPLPSKLWNKTLNCWCLTFSFAAQPVVVTPKPVPGLKEAPRRSLNLEDYKKKRGLI